jgi:tetratricopeptide (TPR) repeat protein
MSWLRCVAIGTVVAAAFVASANGAAGALPDTRRAVVTKLVLQVQRADYEGDRPTLQRLHEALQPFIDDNEFGREVRYWRAFALWRRAINGFNDGVGRPELQTDLQQAVDEFNALGKEFPAFADAKIGALGCNSLIGYILVENGAQFQDAAVQELFGKMRQLRKEAEALAPDNPRLLWVMGPNVWKSPPESGGGEAKAIAMYEKGLQVVRTQKASTGDPLQPSWGEPELLMSLAYSNLHRNAPDLDAAEQYAQSALKLVPYWHYVRDTLLPQIQKAKKSPQPGH